MRENEIKKIENEWDKMSLDILNLQEPNLSEMQSIFDETYKILFDLKSEEAIPKSLAKAFLNMEDFFYFLSIIGENEKLKIDLYYQDLFNIAKTLKDDFFDDSFELEYPKLSIRFYRNKVEFDFEKDKLEDFFKTL